MTTTVIVKTHSWPAEVMTFPLNDRMPVEDGEWTSMGKVEPNSEGTFCVHDGQDLMVRELPVPDES